MQVHQIGLMLIVVSMMAAGQILFKLAAQDLNKFDLLDRQIVGASLTSIPLLAGIVLYGLTTILWVVVLRDADLSRSYLFVALAMVIVAAAGIIIFDEPLSASLIVGGGLIVAGVLVVALGFPTNIRS